MTRLDFGHRRDVVPLRLRHRWRGGSRRSSRGRRFPHGDESPTVACVVSVTWAFARLGLLALRLRADFVVTEAMVACAPFTSVTTLCASTGRGFTPAALHNSPGGQLSRGSPRGRGAVAGRSQASLGRVAGPKWRPGVGHSARGFAKLASVLHAASFKVRRRRAIVDAVSSLATSQHSFRRLPEPRSTPARRAQPRSACSRAVVQAPNALHANAAARVQRAKKCARARAARRSPRTRPSSAGSGARARRAAAPPTRRRRR